MKNLTHKENLTLAFGQTDSTKRDSLGRLFNVAPTFSF